jgi:hypothetical protein
MPCETKINDEEMLDFKHEALHISMIEEIKALTDDYLKKYKQDFKMEIDDHFKKSAQNSLIGCHEICENIDSNTISHY